MSYISTRGSAPELGFEDVLLTGLARDGGLYVPAEWPTLSAGHHRVVRRPAVRRGGRRGDASVRRWSHRQVGSSRHGARRLFRLRPPGGDAARADRAATPGCWSCSTGRRWPSRTSRCSSWRASWIMCWRGAIAEQPSSAPRRETRAARLSRPSDRRAASMSSSCFRTGRVSDVQRRMMTTPTEKNVHAVAVKGTFDDCQALVKGMFNDHAFRDRLSPVGRELDQLGPHRGAGDVLFRRRRSPRRAAPSAHVLGADRQFRRHLRRLGGEAHGPSHRAASSSPRTPTTSCRARTRAASTR